MELSHEIICLMLTKIKHTVKFYKENEMIIKTKKLRIICLMLAAMMLFSLTPVMAAEKVEAVLDDFIILEDMCCDAHSNTGTILIEEPVTEIMWNPVCAISGHSYNGYQSDIFYRRIWCTANPIGCGEQPMRNVQCSRALCSASQDQDWGAFIRTPCGRC